MVVLLVFWLALGTGLGIAVLNHEARRFQREIEALDSLAE